jgi:hypothetical protein
MTGRFIAIGLLGTTQALADPVTVTGGHVTAQMSGGTFTLSGEATSLRRSVNGH